MNKTMALAALLLFAHAASFSCAASFRGDAVKAAELLDHPAEYDDRTLVVQGVVFFTSEGAYLFPNCELAKQLDVTWAISVPKLNWDRILDEDAIRSTVELQGRFVARTEGVINSHHKLLDASFIQKTAELPCAWPNRSEKSTQDDEEEV